METSEAAARVYDYIFECIVTSKEAREKAPYRDRIIQGIIAVLEGHTMPSPAFPAWEDQHKKWRERWRFSWGRG